MASQVVKGIQDPIIREKFLNFKRVHYELSVGERNELEFLQQSFKKVGTMASANLGIEASDILNHDVACFVKIMLAHPEGISKAELVKKLWNYEYDPTVHDRRIYKLVSKARLASKNQDWLLNTYGRYRLNPKYRLIS